MRTVNKNIFQSSTCLTQDELIRYHQNKMSESEKHLVEHHLTDCELCSEALEGIVLLPDMNSLENASEKINAKYLTKPIEKNLFQNSKVWYAAASVIVLFVFGSVFFNYVAKKNNQVSENAAIQKGLNNSDKAVIKEAPQQPNVQAAAIGDTVVQLVSKASRKVADKSYESAKDYSKQREQQIQPATISSATNQLPHGTVVYKDEKSEATQEDAAAEVLSAPEEKKDVILETPVITAKANSKYKTYNYSREYNRKERKNLERFSTQEANQAKAGINEPLYKSADSGKNNYDNLVAAAISEYESKNYKEALKKFNDILNKHPDDVNALYYSALCYEEQGNYNSAIKYLDKLLAQPIELFNQDAQWHRALIFIEQKENDKAKLLLQEIIVANGFYAEQAKLKLTKL